MFNKNSHQPLGIKDKVISTGLLIPEKKITIKIFKKVIQMNVSTLCVHKTLLLGLFVTCRLKFVFFNSTACFTTS